MTGGSREAGAWCGLVSSGPGRLGKLGCPPAPANTPGLFNKSSELGPIFPEGWRPLPGSPPMVLGSVLFFWWL